MPRRQRLTPGLWALLLLIALIVMLAAFGPVRELLRYQRDAIINGHQWWRLISGHLVHGSWQHTGLNLAGLIIMVVLFRDAYRASQWLMIGLVSAFSIDAGLLVLMPQLHWYVGLSGVLHGVLAAGAVAWWRTESPLMAAVLSVILVGKLGWEQWQGALPLSGDLKVIVNAHWYGAVGGLLMGLVLSQRALRTLN